MKPFLQYTLAFLLTLILFAPIWFCVITTRINTGFFIAFIPTWIAFFLAFFHVLKWINKTFESNQ